MSPSKSYFKVAVLTLSNSKRLANDDWGKYLRNSIRSAHCLSEHQHVKDDVYQMRAVLSRWIANSKINGDYYHRRNWLWPLRYYSRGD